jgi:hypothetical protein
MKRRLGVAAVIGALAVALAVVLTGCGGESDSGGVASLTDTTSTTESGDGGSTGNEKDSKEAALDFAKCMREHGVDMPDPGSGGELRLQVTPGTERKVQEAQQACQHFMEDAAPRLSEEQEAVMKDALLDFARCMREHGIDMPDPEFGKGGIVTQKNRFGRGTDPDDPKFRAAQKACEPIMEEASKKAGLPERSPSRSRSGGS